MRLSLLKLYRTLIQNFRIEKLWILRERILEWGIWDTLEDNRDLVHEGFSRKKAEFLMSGRDDEGQLKIGDGKAFWEFQGIAF